MFFFLGLSLCASEKDGTLLLFLFGVCVGVEYFVGLWNFLVTFRLCMAIFTFLPLCCALLFFAEEGGRGLIVVLGNQIVKSAH